MRVFVPTHLRAYTGGKAQVEAAGATLGALLWDLDAQFPGVRFRIIDEQDHVRTHIRFFFNGGLVRTLDAAAPTGGELTIVAALSGG